MDYEIDPEQLMQILIARRRNKPKYKISISRNIFQDIMKETFTVNDLHAFINHPKNSMRRKTKNMPACHHFLERKTHVIMDVPGNYLVTRNHGCSGTTRHLLIYTK